jgi:hypothetical protein
LLRSRSLSFPSRSLLLPSRSLLPLLRAAFLKSQRPTIIITLTIERHYTSTFENFLVHLRFVAIIRSKFEKQNGTACAGLVEGLVLVQLRV